MPYCLSSRNRPGFLGREKISGLEGIQVQFTDGATLRLGEAPFSVSDGLRDEVESKLGRKTFVDPRDTSIKRPGRFAMTVEQLREPLQASDS